MNKDTIRMALGEVSSALFAVDRAILATESGDARNALCDANIKLLEAEKRLVEKLRVNEIRSVEHSVSMVVIDEKQSKIDKPV